VDLWVGGARRWVWGASFAIGEDILFKAKSETGVSEGNGSASCAWGNKSD
jgi:hypothetical protein